ncbi:MAG: hypothetical protein LBJ63_06030 [Prevotellaceae bacterium]|nr:hypothetical protein [Prevotellaceae bacterium]
MSSYPLSIEGGLNVYAYVHDSNSWIDPYGNEYVGMSNSQ